MNATAKQRPQPNQIGDTTKIPNRRQQQEHTQNKLATTIPPKRIGDNNNTIKKQIGDRNNTTKNTNWRQQQRNQKSESVTTTTRPTHVRCNRRDYYRLAL